MSTFPEQLKSHEPFFQSWYLDELIGEGRYGKVYRITRKKWGFRQYSALRWLTIPETPSEIDTLRLQGLTDEQIRAELEKQVDELFFNFQQMNRLKDSGHVAGFEEYTACKRNDGSIGFNVFVRMKLLTPLTKYVHTHKCTAGDVVNIGMDICKALQACEEHRIMHLNIKPDNIFKSGRNCWMLGDHSSAGQVGHAIADGMMGANRYLAPEFYQTSRSDAFTYSSATDIYALGILLRQLLNLHQPRTANHSIKEREAFNLHRLNGEPLPPPDYGSAQLHLVIAKACAFAPQERYQTAREFRQALESLRET